MERKIGEVFKDGEIKLKVKRSKNVFSCIGCHYDDIIECPNVLNINICYHKLRSDHKSVIFVKQN